jgi:importin subunit beta-1
MPHLHPFLLACLKNFEAYQVCPVAVGLVSGISRVLGSALLPYCDEIVTVLLQMLQKYWQVTLMMLLQASSTVAPEDDDEMIDCVNIL